MNEKYDKVFSKYTDGVYIFDYLNIPENRTVFIISAKEFNEKMDKWIDYIEGRTFTHPNNYFEYIHGSCKFTTQNILDIFTEITIKSRFHGVCKKLLKKDFEYCFQFYSAGEKPFIIVSQEWFESIANDNYATYTMIDIIGMKNYLHKYGKIGKDVITNYKKTIDCISLEEKNCLFITFTDNIFIKTNWKSSPSDYEKTYQPEHMIYLIKNVQEAIYNVFKLDSYAIIAQGIQLFHDDESLNHNIDNHFFIGSVATPFIELFDIETAIKSKIVNNPEFKKNLYLSESFYASLKFDSSIFDKENFGITEKLTENRSGVSMDIFRAMNIEELLEKISNSTITST
jgi:hypothetical protein